MAALCGSCSITPSFEADQQKNNERHKKENLQFSLSFSSKFLIVSTHLVRVIKWEILFLLFVSSFLFLLSDKKQMCCVKWCVPDAWWWVRRVSFSYFDSCFHFSFFCGERSLWVSQGSVILCLKMSIDVKVGLQFYAQIALLVKIFSYDKNATGFTDTQHERPPLCVVKSWRDYALFLFRLFQEWILFE